MQKQKTSKLAITTLILSIAAIIPGIIGIISLLSAWATGDIYGFGLAVIALGLLFFLALPLGAIALIFSFFAQASIKKNNLKGAVLLKISWILLLLVIGSISIIIASVGSPFR